MTELTYDIDTSELSEECDGMFLLLDTARHGGFRRTDQEIVEHIKDCEECFEQHSEYI